MSDSTRFSQDAGFGGIWTGVDFVVLTHEVSLSFSAMGLLIPDWKTESKVSRKARKGCERGRISTFDI